MAVRHLILPVCLILPHTNYATLQDGIQIGQVLSKEGDIFQSN